MATRVTVEKEQSGMECRGFDVVVLCLLVIAGVAAYWNSFQGVFLFDDLSILNSSRLHRLWPVTELWQNDNRPVLTLSLALNYAVNGIDPWGYHAVNLVIHLLAAMTLYGILRRTFSSNRFAQKVQADSGILAFGAALIWAVHPLQTASVTYITQRAESLMGLFYLLTLYGSIRFLSGRQKRWLVTAGAACLLGMGTKEVMVTAPLLVLVYDRIFVSKAWADIFRHHLRLHLSLMACWLVPGMLLLSTNAYRGTVGFQYEGFTWAQYALTQPEIILHYLKSVFYPAVLCLDYRWPVADSPVRILVPLLAVGGMFVWSFVWLFRRAAVGFWGLWFFLILSVSSGLVPIQDLAFDHRMYLSLAGVVVLVLLGTHWALTKTGMGDVLRRTVLAVVCFSLAAGLGRMTHQRNEVFHSGSAMWRDVIAKRPRNARAYNNFGFELLEDGDARKALEVLPIALRINPNYEEAYNNMGLAYLRLGQFAAAQNYFERAVALAPAMPEALSNLGYALFHQGRVAEAKARYRQAIAADPDYPDAYNNLGVALVKEGRYQEAEQNYRKAVRLKPHYAQAYNNLGVLSIYKNSLAEAEAYLKKALALDPGYAKALNSLGVVYKLKKRFTAAEQLFRQSLAQDPDYADPRRNLEELKGMMGRE